MKHIHTFESFLNEGNVVNEKMDTKYWSDYNDDTSGQMPKEHSVWNTKFEDAFEDAVTDWQSEAEEKLNSSDIKKIRKIAEEYFKIEKKISIAVVQAMIMQES